jgi:hypothetical protein
MLLVEESCSISKAAGAILARKNETCFIISHLNNISIYRYSYESSLEGEFDVASRESV